MTRSLDATRSPMAFFGAELRRARLAAGMSQDQLGRTLSFSGDMVGKVETGERAPSADFSARCDTAFPHLDGLFTRLLGLARRWDGPYPQWFRDWVDAEREASSLRTWEPLLIPGLLQTPDYARSLFMAWHSADSEDELEQLVSARIARQSIFERPAPPTMWAVIDEGVLHRRVGSSKIMYDQFMHLVGVSGRSKITIQVVPDDVGAHVGLLGAFAVANFDGTPSIVYMESPDEGLTTDRPSVVAKVSEIFDALRAEALPRRASRDLIKKVAEERWT